tara:strand:+ start:625 stop:1077 length:453 start_codon:yes stop_codon:yes gene_type:complete
MLTAINNSKIDISKEESTKELAESFANHLKGGEIIYLHGEMGVGKTTFIRYLINKFQKNNNLNLTEITSPTFSLLNEYQINSIVIKHYDLFRLKDRYEIKDLNIFESDKKSIILIEWPKLIDKQSIKTIDLYFTYENELKNRYVIINGLS